MKKKKGEGRNPEMAAEKVVGIIGVFCAVVFTAICVGVVLFLVGFLANIIF